MAKVYHVGIRWIKTETSTEKIKEIETALGAMGDWARLNAFNWYVYTDRTANAVYEALRTKFQTDDSIAVVAVDPHDVSGWAPEWFWKWINSKRQPQPINWLANPPR